MERIFDESKIDTVRSDEFEIDPVHSDESKMIPCIEKNPKTGPVNPYEFGEPVSTTHDQISTNIPDEGRQRVEDSILEEHN